MSTERVNETKEKILSWLKEEACSPIEQTDPNAFFNIAIKVGRIGCQVVQPVQKMDSFIVLSRIPVSSEMMELLKGIDAEKKTALFWDLRLSIVKDNELLDFKIEADSPEEIKSITLSSRPIFYDALTKSKLFSAIFSVTNATLMVMFTVQKYAGKMPSKKDEQKLPYST